MSPADIARYSDAFVSIEELRDFMRAELAMSFELSFLSFDGELNSSDRARTLSTISQLDGLNRFEINAARLLVENVKSGGGTMTSADVKTLDGYLDVQQKFRGPCVDRAAALKLIAPIRAPGAGRAR